MTARELLHKALETLDQRGGENGYDKRSERSAAEIAHLWNWHTDKHMEEADAWRFMICLKEVRLKRQLANGSDPTDTLVDLLGYTALLAECLTGKS